MSHPESDDAQAARADVDEGWRRFGLIADEGTDAVYETDRHSNIRWISPSVQRLLGWAPEELIGTKAVDLVNPEDLPVAHAMRARIYGPDDSVTEPVSARFLQKSGEYLLLSVRARPLKDAEGETVGAVVSLRDTAEKVAALRALTTLSRGNAVLVRARDEQTLLTDMCQSIVTAGQYRFAWYGRPEGGPGRPVRPIASAGSADGYLDEVEISWDADNPLGRGPTGTSIRTGQTQVFNDFAGQATYGPWRSAAQVRGFRGSISLPVFVDGAVDGALMVYADVTGAFDHLAKSLMEDLAADIGYGIGRLRDRARLTSAFRSSVQLLAAAVESRDEYTAGHQTQVGWLSGQIGKELDFGRERIEGLILGGSIHDVGKIAVPQRDLEQMRETYGR